MIDNDDTIKSTDELLIDCVRGYPHLYNHQDKNFKDHLMKENSWKEIASVMKMSVSECQTQWNRLRDKFAREKRQKEIETRSGSEASHRNTFVLYENMLFLEKHVKRRRSYTNVSKRPKLAFDTERNSIIESESFISVFNENSELSPMSTTLFDEDNVSLTTPNVITYEKTPLRSPASQSFSPVQTMRKSVLEWEDSNHSIGSTPSPAPLQSGLRSTPSPALLQSGLRSTPSPAPLQSGLRSTPSPAPLQSGSQSTPSPAHLQSGSRSTPSPALAPRECTSNIKKTKDLNKMEESFFNLTQVIQQRFMDPRNSRSTSTADNSFASLIVAELEALPEAEKRNRKQRILQILYESYNA
ncbi:MADF domain-containing protein [Camponotus japonicus]